MEIFSLLIHPNYYLDKLQMKMAGFQIKQIENLRLNDIMIGMVFL